MEREKRIEQRLSNYKNIDRNIKMLEIKLEREKVLGSPRDIKAVDFSKVGHGGGGQKPAEIVLANVQGLISQINNLKYEKELIENFLDIVKENSIDEYNFIKYYYFDNLSVIECLDKLGYSYNSRTTIYRMKKNIFERFDDFVI